MRRQTQLAKLIEASEDKIRYDTQVKKVLANEAILAWILKTCTEEFASCSLHEIRKCIEVPEISRKAVHQNEPDAPLDSDRQIESVGTEDGSLGEQTVFYDIRFHACAPGKARPVHLMNVLLAVDLEAKEKQRVMEKEFHIAMTAELESEVSELCNLSQGVYDKGVKAGISQGINQGMSLGISQGIRATVAILQRYQYQDAEIMEQIMQEYHLTPEEARQYVSVPDSV